MVQDVVFILRLGDHLKFPFKDQWNILFLRSFPVFYQHPPKSANFLHTTGYDHDGETGQHKPKGILPAVVSAVSSTETDGPSHLCSSMQMNNLSVAYLGHHLYEKNYHSAKKPVPTATHIVYPHSHLSKAGLWIVPANIPLYCTLLLKYTTCSFFTWKFTALFFLSVKRSDTNMFPVSQILIFILPFNTLLWTLIKVMTSSNKRELWVEPFLKQNWILPKKKV